MDWTREGTLLVPAEVRRGLVFHYGSYRDYPNLNGVLLTLNVYVGRSW